MAPSISSRLTLSLVIVSAAMFLLAGTAIYVGLSMTLESAARVELQRKIRVVQHFVEEAARGGDLVTLRHRMDDILIGHDELRVWLLGADGHPVYSKTPLPTQQPTQGVFSVQGTDGARLKAISTPLVGAEALGIGSAVVALDTTPRERLLNSLILLMGAVGTAAIMLTLVLGWAAVKRGLGALHRMSEESTAISPTAPGRRLTTDGIARELEEIAIAFNAVLDRLEAAYTQVEAFNADVAHELRTPLATLISGTQLALLAKRPVNHLLETLGSNLEDLEALRILVNDMLFLAQADHGALAHEMTATDLRSEVLEVVEFFDAWLAEAQLRVEVVGTAGAHCTPTLIRRAVSNLLSNAIKYTTKGGSISILLDEVDGFARVSVSNPGSRVNEEVRRRMFDRFFRADPARDRVGESHGLGLAIVRAIAQMHNGHVFAQDTADGIRIGMLIRHSPPLG